MIKDIHREVKDRVYVCDLCRKEEGADWTDSMIHFEEQIGVFKGTNKYDVHGSCLYTLLKKAMNHPNPLDI